MGRTNPTFRDRLSGIEREFADYRRALRRRDRPHFDRLFAHARAHADACSYLNHDAPLAAVLFSVALEQEARLAALDARLDALEAEAGIDPDERRSVDDAQARLERPWTATGDGERGGDRDAASAVGDDLDRSGSADEPDRAGDAGD
jgi:hypothetical protein